MASEISDNGGKALLRTSELRGGMRPAPAQAFNELSDMHIALARSARSESVAMLNQVLADSMTLRDLYKKHHWQVSGAAFYPLHQMYDKHHSEQEELVDALAERVQTLGGVAIAMSADVADATLLARPPRDRETPSLQLTRLLGAHERVLHVVRAAARRAAALGDDGTNDLLVSGVIRTNEKQAWFIQEHLQRDPSGKGR